jgi:1,2-dihydroxy-3-keto-5-methylthiopentene dioxygenase
MMSKLSIYTVEQPPKLVREEHEGEQIQAALETKGIDFQRWKPQGEVVPGGCSDNVLELFAEHIETIKQQGGYEHVDVISLDASHPDKEALRQQFLSEHTHSEDEVRFFVAGEGLFSFHLDDEVYQVLCEKNDFISVPAGTKHWFDMGPEPHLVAIRLFIDPVGWVANSTEDDIASRYPML